MTVKINKGNAAGLINLTPMIDVVFQLLLFFLIASEFAQEERQLEVVLPQASEAKPLISKPRELFVNIDQRGGYFVDGRFIDPGELEKILKSAAADNPGHQTVIIRADKRAIWEHVVKVMDLCNKARIRDYRVTTADLPAKRQS